MKLKELIDVIEPFQKYEVYSNSGVWISNPHYIFIYEAKVLNVYATRVGVIVIDIELAKESKEKKED
jgi:hypothetical protein